MHCRRCQSPRLIPLEKKHQEDNNVFRCQECGYIFSPAATIATATDPSLSAANSPNPYQESHTTAVQSGYPARG